MPTPRKPAKPRAKTPDQKFWTVARKAAFEAVRSGAEPAEPESTVRGWQADPRWQAKLAKRDEAVEAVAVSREVERTNLLEEACSSALRFWAEMLGDREQNPFVRTQAANSVWSLKMKLDEKAQARALNRVWDISFQATVWE